MKIANHRNNAQLFFARLQAYMCKCCKKKSAKKSDISDFKENRKAAKGISHQYLHSSCVHSLLSHFVYSLRPTSLDFHYVLRSVDLCVVMFERIRGEKRKIESCIVSLDPESCTTCSCF